MKNIWVITARRSDDSYRKYSREGDVKNAHPTRGRTAFYPLKAVQSPWKHILNMFMLSYLGMWGQAWIQPTLRERMREPIIWANKWYHYVLCFWESSGISHLHNISQCAQMWSKRVASECLTKFQIPLLKEGPCIFTNMALASDQCLGMEVKKQLFKLRWPW